MPNNGTGRGDGDEGSKINQHIGYLEVITYQTGAPKINPYKAYIRTGPYGMRVNNGQKNVKFQIHRYFLKRMDVNENDDLKDAEDKPNWNAEWNRINSGRYDAYIKIAEKSHHNKS